MLDYQFNQDTLTLARDIELLALDVDGVLSNGTLYFGNDGEELKGFSILDGLGIKLLHDHGIIVAIITGRSSEIVNRRAKNLNIQHIIQGREDKLVALKELIKNLNIEAENTAYMGDDLPDLSAIQFAKFGITVPNAHASIRQRADYVCANCGGHGAVREVSDLLLSAKGKLTQTIDNFSLVEES